MSKPNRWFETHLSATVIEVIAYLHKTCYSILPHLTLKMPLHQLLQPCSDASVEWMLVPLK